MQVSCFQNYIDQDTAIFALSITKHLSTKNKKIFHLNKFKTPTFDVHLTSGTVLVFNLSGFDLSLNSLSCGIIALLIRVDQLEGLFKLSLNIQLTLFRRKFCQKIQYLSKAIYVKFPKKLPRIFVSQRIIINMVCTISKVIKILFYRQETRISLQLS